jgi:nuclease-like protein/AAA domain-containing protein/UvrD-like helicase family protein
MAQVFCSSNPDLIEPSEARVLPALKGLPPEWLVFHSVAWQSLRGRRQGDGEADFVLVHPAIGLLILEVKGGGISVVDGRWTSTNQEGIHEIKDPFLQAVASKHALLRYCANLAPQPIRCNAGHAVVFPDITIDAAISTYGPRSLILDRKDLQDCPQAIERACRYHGLSSQLKKAELDRLKRLLAPTLRIRRTLRDQIDDADHGLLELTRLQIDVLRASRTNRRLFIRGGAGTGKTVLAVQRARDQAEEGGRVLYVCYNKPLADFVSRTLADTPRVSATTFHGLCAREVRDARMPWPSEPSDEWWRDGAPANLIDAAAANASTFDSIIIDEGQDFEPSWIHAIELLLVDPQESPMYVFADSHQSLYRRNWAVPRDWPVCELDINCRNTKQIAEMVASIYGDHFRTLGVTGPTVAFLEGNLHRDGERLVQQVVGRLLEEEHLAPAQVTVLSNSGAFVSQLVMAGVVGDHVFCEIGKRGIVSETIARFKGLESDAVVLALDDDAAREGPLASAELYVGLSRARTLLYIIGSRVVATRLGPTR